MYAIRSYYARGWLLRIGLNLLRSEKRKKRWQREVLPGILPSVGAFEGAGYMSRGRNNFV